MYCLTESSKASSNSHLSSWVVDLAATEQMTYNVDILDTNKPILGNKNFKVAY